MCPPALVFHIRVGNNTNVNLFYFNLRCSSILGWRFGQYHLEESRFVWEQWFLWKQEVSVPAAGNLANSLCVAINYHRSKVSGDRQHRLKRQKLFLTLCRVSPARPTLPKLRPPCELLQQRSSLHHRHSGADERPWKGRITCILR